MQDLPTAILYFRRIDRFSRFVLCALQNVIYDLDLRHSDLASVRHSGYLTFSYKLAHRSVFQVKHFAKLFCTYSKSTSTCSSILCTGSPFTNKNSVLSISWRSSIVSNAILSLSADTFPIIFILNGIL